MKKIIYWAFIAALLVTSCSKKVDTGVEKPIIPGPFVDTLRGVITFSDTLKKNVYLHGIVIVDSGVSLYIKPGVTIYGSPGANSIDFVDYTNNKGALIVRRGAKLFANGTPNAPIVWTSSQPVGLRNYGDWGGLAILGRAPVVTSSGAISNILEAFRISVFNYDSRMAYGGGTRQQDIQDNSGSITYNRFEFGGGLIRTLNAELDAFTLAGVGEGTNIHHIEVMNSGDDGFAFYGGRVSVKHLLSFNNRDDDYDFDEAYEGKLQFIIAYRGDLADGSGSTFVESDNNETLNVYPGGRSKPFIANATFIGPQTLAVRPGVTGTFDGGVYVRKESLLLLANSIIVGNALTNVFAVTPSTIQYFSFDLTNPLGSAIGYNMWQTTSPTPFVIDANEPNPISLTPIRHPFNPNDYPTNSFYTSYASLKLDGFLVPQAGSPALSGGYGLNGPEGWFVGTKQRGAVMNSDQWTRAGNWISFASN